MLFKLTLYLNVHVYTSAYIYCTWKYLYFFVVKKNKAAK